MPTVADVARRLNSRAKKGMPALILMTDAARMPDPLPAVRKLPRGAAVIFRHYAAPDRQRLAETLARECRRRHLVLLIAADARLAARTGARGLHLPEGMVRRGRLPWARQIRPGWLVTAAAHGPAAVRRAARAGVDAVLLSPVFPTASHPGAGALGILRFTRWCRSSTLPVYALGGIQAVRASRLLGSGACGIAGIAGMAAVEGMRAPC